MKKLCVCSALALHSFGVYLPFVLRLRSLRTVIYLRFICGANALLLHGACVAFALISNFTHSTILLSSFYLSHSLCNSLYTHLTHLTLTSLSHRSSNHRFTPSLSAEPRLRLSRYLHLSPLPPPLLLPAAAAARTRSSVCSYQTSFE
jgi:hypothetical protein